MSEPQIDNTRDNNRDDLTQIRGIGDVRQQWFNETFNVYTFRELAALSADAIEERTKAEGRPISRRAIEEWLAEAADFAARSTMSETHLNDEAVMAYESPTSLTETVRSAMQSGSSDARAAAAKAIPRMREQITKTVYTTSYYVSFGVVFSSLIVASAVPMDNIIGAGLRDGADAARGAVQQQIAARAAYRAQRGTGGAEGMTTA